MQLGDLIRAELASMPPYQAKLMNGATQENACLPRHVVFALCLMPSYSQRMSSCCLLPVARVAPEVLMGGRCTQSVDIYSFSVLLWEIITGEVLA